MSRLVVQCVYTKDTAADNNVLWDKHNNKTHKEKDI